MQNKFLQIDWFFYLYLKDINGPIRKISQSEISGRTIYLRELNKK